MLNKKIVILTIFFVSLLSISVVSATENTTSDIVSVNDATEVNNLYDDVADDNELINSEIINDQGILGNTESQDEISLDNNTDILSVKSPSSSDYEVSISAPTTYYESSTGTVTVNIVSPCTISGYYAYHFRLNVFNSNGGTGYSKEYYGTSSSPVKYTFDPKQYGLGTHKITVQNYAEPTIMATSTLTIKNGYPSSSDYSVNVHDNAINYGSSGFISMSITPATKTDYKYYYYLKVYNSNNQEVISQLYSGVNSMTSVSYTITANKLSSGNYTIKIINYKDNNVMDTAKLTIKTQEESSTSPSYSDYSVKVSDISMSYGSSSSISMSITPATKTTYKYNYYLKVYDSNNNEKISELYSGTAAPYSRTYTIAANELSAGNYTIKIINVKDSKVMSTAALKVNNVVSKYPSYSDYSVKISDTNITYGYSGTISMNITPSSMSSYQYCYYLYIYDSNNNEKLSELYYDTSASYSKTYTIAANKLSVGTYTIKIINFQDSEEMASAKLIVSNNPTSSIYSVKVSDTNMYLESTEYIYMTINPASKAKYKYNYYLKIYDSNNNEKISKEYSSTNGDTYKSYYIGSNLLSVGTYTVKIINYADNNVMSTSKLTVKSYDPLASEYSVKVSDISMYYGSSGFISMNITPASFSDFKYNYYLKVYDSNNNEMFSKGYYSTTAAYSKTYIINANSLSVGTYTIKIINYKDNNLMDSAILTVMPKNVVNLNAPLSIYTTYNSMNKYYDSELVITLQDEYGHDLLGELVTVNLNGKTITKTIDYVLSSSQGELYGAIFELSDFNLIPKTYSAKITFDGNKLYEKSEFITKVTIKKATPKITAKAKTFKKSVKTKKYTITLKNNLNKVMKNTKVTIKVNKKTYTAKTNSKGVATFKITKLTKKGTFKSVITYNGDKYYNKVTKKVNIKIK